MPGSDSTTTSFQNLNAQTTGMCSAPTSATQYYLHIETGLDPDEPVVPPEPLDDYGDTIEEATAVEPSSATQGTIGSSDDVDYFEIQVAEEGLISA